MTKDNEYSCNKSIMFLFPFFSLLLLSLFFFSLLVLLSSPFSLLLLSLLYDSNSPVGFGDALPLSSSLLSLSALAGFCSDFGRSGGATNPAMVGLMRNGIGGTCQYLDMMNWYVGTYTIFLIHV